MELRCFHVLRHAEGPNALLPSLLMWHVAPGWRGTCPPRSGSLPCSTAGAHCGSEELEVGDQDQWEDSHTRQLSQACMALQEVCFASYSSGLTLGAGMVPLA